MQKMIHYWMRLGDIINCFPIAKRWSEEGHSVRLNCHPEYHAIFQCVDYVTPSAEQRLPEGALDLQVWPLRYDHYRASKQCWQDYVFGLAGMPDLAHAAPTFTNTHVDLAHYGLTVGEYDLLAPIGISQLWRPTPQQFYDAALKQAGMEHKRIVWLLPPGNKCGGMPYITARMLAELPGLIKHARKFFCVSSAPSIIAAGVRREYHCCYLPDFDGQDYRTFAGQTTVRLDL